MNKLYKNVNGVKVEITGEELEARIAKEKEYLDNRYKELRLLEYPAIGEQLDMLFHELADKGTIDPTGEWFQKIKEIKDNHPKPQ